MRVRLWREGEDSSSVTRLPPILYRHRHYRFPLRRLMMVLLQLVLNTIPWLPSPLPNSSTSLPPPIVSRSIPSPLSGADHPGSAWPPPTSTAPSLLPLPLPDEVLQLLLLSASNWRSPRLRCATYNTAQKITRSNKYGVEACHPRIQMMEDRNVLSQIE
jgi:hypothetical protein